MFFNNPTASSTSSTSKDSFTTTAGTQVYTRPLLVGATILQLSYDGKGQTDPTDYTFDDTTGEITFVITVDTGISVNVIYTS